MYIYIIILFITLGSMVCELCNITTLHITFISNLFCKYGKNLLPLQTKNNNNQKYNPTNPNVMIIKHFTGGGYRLLLPPSMQCVACVAIPAILFAMTICLSSCATARQGDEIKVHNKVGDRVQL